MPCNGNVARLVANVKTHHRHPGSSTDTIGRWEEEQRGVPLMIVVLVQESPAQNALYASYTIARFYLL